MKLELSLTHDQYVTLCLLVSDAIEKKQWPAPTTSEGLAQLNLLFGLLHEIEGE